jgi:hypothetical protein
MLATYSLLGRASGSSDPFALSRTSSRRDADNFARPRSTPEVGRGARRSKFCYSDHSSAQDGDRAPLVPRGRPARKICAAVPQVPTSQDWQIDRAQTMKRFAVGISLARCENEVAPAGFDAGHGCGHGQAPGLSLVDTFVSCSHARLSS